MIEFGLKGAAVVVETELASAWNVAASRQLFNTEHNEPDPRCNAPNMSVVGIFLKEIVNEVVSNAFQE